MGGSGIFSDIFISRQVDLAVQTDVAIRTISDLVVLGLFTLFFFGNIIFLHQGVLSTHRKRLGLQRYFHLRATGGR